MVPCAEMAGGVTWRLTVASGVALLCAGAMALLLSSAPANAGGGKDGDLLYPDLIVESPSDIALQKDPATKRVYLRFSHTTSNVGAGPLEIFPDLKTETCGDEGDRGRVAYQAVYRDQNANGTFEPAVDTQTSTQGVGCMIYHEIHHHYHFEDFARYELYRVTSGRLRSVSEKVSFCVFDVLNSRPDLPGAPPNPVYNYANCGTDSGIHGISVGWADVYGAGVPGQEFDVTGTHPGRFCLVAKTDPTNRLTELPPGGEDNNVQTVQIHMNTKRASQFSTPVRIDDKPCAPPAAFKQ